MKNLGENSLRVKCPSCGEMIEVTIRKVSKPSLADVREAIRNFLDEVELSESDDSIVVTPKEFLEKKTWYQINSALQEFNAEWISAGKESIWMIKKA